MSWLVKRKRKYLHLIVSKSCLTKLVRVSFNFLPKVGRKMSCMLLGGKYVTACKASSKLGGSGDIFPGKILILALLLDTIWWNLGLFIIDICQV